MWFAESEDTTVTQIVESLGCVEPTAPNLVRNALLKAQACSLENHCFPRKLILLIIRLDCLHSSASPLSKTFAEGTVQMEKYSFAVLCRELRVFSTYSGLCDISTCWLLDYSFHSHCSGKPSISKKCWILKCTRGFGRRKNIRFSKGGRASQRECAINNVLFGIVLNTSKASWRPEMTTRVPRTLSCWTNQHERRRLLSHKNVELVRME